MTGGNDGPIFTPDNEPYLGRQSVFHFDRLISDAMEKNEKIGPWTQNNKLSALQRASTELIPHGFSIALSIRELVRQGYLISAEVLLRPLIERAAVISYLCETPSALSLWEAGWPHKSRPPLYKLLAAMKGEGKIKESEEIARQITQHFNAIVHADPIGARRRTVQVRNGRLGYSVSKSITDPQTCDEICIQATAYLAILTARASQIFHEAVAQRH